MDHQKKLKKVAGRAKSKSYTSFPSFWKNLHLARILKINANLVKFLRANIFPTNVEKFVSNTYCRFFVFFSVRALKAALPQIRTTANKIGCIAYWTEKRLNTAVAAAHILFHSPMRHRCLEKKEKLCFVGETKFIRFLRKIAISGSQFSQVRTLNYFFSCKISNRVSASNIDCHNGKKCTLAKIYVSL